TGGEKILEVNGVTVKEKSLHKAADMMAGPAGSFIDLKLEKNEKVFSLKIKRENIRLRPLVCKVYRDGIGYIKCSIFGDSTEFQFSKALDKLKARNVKALIIDLRNNPGGDFESSLKVASFFVQRKPLIYYKKRTGEPKPVVSVRPIKFSGPVAVIVNGGTASAAEILTAALSENKKAVVVGTRTFGKAKVQTIFSLTGGSAIKLTTAEYLTPTGKNINEVGIIPEIIVEDNPSSKDAPLSKAIQYLKSNNK
ncbi:MAG: S41 family peptidase, partial [Firmicutes bacterium]|nr:S41 family peptidase [Bacillota bacterium]